MAFKKSSAPAAAPETPDQLFRDLPRRRHPSLFDHQGHMLRAYVADAVNRPDVALQLPTGSGKTLVGLLLAEWRRRRNKERVLYLCPTRQLVNQVADEASSKYGMTVEPFTGPVKAYSPSAKAAYDNAERVAVTTFSSLFNTNPYFSNPELIIVDDTHASENYIAAQWTVNIKKDDDELLFAAASGVLRGILAGADHLRLTGASDLSDDAVWVDKIAMPSLAAIEAELRAVITENIGNSDQRYPWSMIADHLHACHVYVARNEITIRPLIPPTWTHAPFTGATQRIYMSATLGAGGDLERLTGRKRIHRMPIPEGWDRQGIGRRLFIFPEKSLDDAQSKALRLDLMRKAGRSLVLTPSTPAASAVGEEVGKSLGYPVYYGSDLEERKAEFVKADRAVACVANRYDGIDFPDDECRLLFIEGLPRAVNLQERFLMGRMGANVLFNERVQTRVVQAMGRCTRGLNDYSAVVVTGEHLPTYLTDQRRRGFFHPELQAELTFGIEQSTSITSSDLKENVDIFLEHQSAWETANEDIIAIRRRSERLPLPGIDELSSAVTSEIDWQQAIWDRDYIKALDAAREVLGKLQSPELRGYRALWHYLAGSVCDTAGRAGEERLGLQASDHFRRAKDAAFGIPWLVALSRGGSGASTPQEQEAATTMLQVERLEAYLVRLGTLHNRAFSSREREIRDGLATAKHFEEAQVLLGRHLGFEAGKVESDASPDPWWRNGGITIVFEDHAAAGDNAVIDATKARQAASHPDWVRAHLAGGEDDEIEVVLVTPAKRAKQGAMPHLKRVSLWELDRFRTWAEEALNSVRDLRRTFVEPGDLAWRAEAAKQLTGIGAEANGLRKRLRKRAADKLLEPVA